MEIIDLSPELILFNGKIHTMSGARTVRALAARDGRFTALGDDEEIKKLAGPGTGLFDLRGRTVVPGIFDSHNHLMEVGTKLSHLRLDECESAQEMAELVREKAKETPPGQWIIGEGWNEGNFKTGELPTRADLDKATDKHPVVLMRFFNIFLVNTVALRLAGVDKNTPDPEGGKIEREADGSPNGLLRASAKTYVKKLIPRPTLEELKERIDLSCREMHRFGITSVIEPGLYPWEMQAYQAAHRDGILTVRTNLMPSWHGFREEENEDELNARAIELGIFSGLGDEWLKMGGLKMAIDGGTSPHTSYMYEPFVGETEVKNYNRLDPESLRKYFRMAQEHGWDVGIHCCGDRSQDMAVEAFAEIAGQVPSPDARHNIIHAYFPTDKSLELMKRHNIAAVIQPTFIHWEGDLIFRDVGEERVRNYIPARKYLDHGILVTSSSDVESTVSADPFRAMYSLVTRKNAEGLEIAPDQAVSREEALASYTSAGTWLTREENLKGTIETGKLADAVVLDRDFFAVADEELKEIKVDATIVGGKVLYEREF